MVNAAYLALSFPGNKTCVENLELMQNQWVSNMERLQKLVDDSIDTEAFIRACESSIIRDTYKTQTAVQEKNSMAIIMNALNIGRRANRIMQVAGQEAENSEEFSFVERIIDANNSLKHCN